MKSLFNQNDYLELIARINKLKPDSTPIWGKMNVEQMLTHAQAPLQVAFGDLKLEQGFIGILFGKMAKKQMLNQPEFKRNLPTHKRFLVLDKRNFDEEKSKLLAFIKRFHEGGAAGITSETHPFFGKLTIEEWDALQWKHLDHHLRQFGA